MTKLQSLSMRIAKLQAEFEEEKQYIRNEHTWGQHEGFTVYQVKSTRIKAHKRRGYVAVRVRIKHGTL